MKDYLSMAWGAAKKVAAGGLAALVLTTACSPKNECAAVPEPAPESKPVVEQVEEKPKEPSKCPVQLSTYEMWWVNGKSDLSYSESLSALLKIWHTQSNSLYRECGIEYSFGEDSGIRLTLERPAYCNNEEEDHLLIGFSFPSNGEYSLFYDVNGKTLKEFIIKDKNGRIIYSYRGEADLKESAEARANTLAHRAVNSIYRACGSQLADLDDRINGLDDSESDTEVIEGELSPVEVQRYDGAPFTTTDVPTKSRPAPEVPGYEGPAKTDH